MSLSEIHTVCSEYLAATDRISASLKTLKRELTAMREQDVRLLKQLIHINETIRRMSNSRELQHAKSFTCYQLTSGCATLPRRKPPLVRQQSEPQFLTELQHSSSLISSSTSSQETLGSQDDVSSGNEMEDNCSPSFRRLLFRLRPRSFSVLSPAYLPTDEFKGGDSFYDEILKRNIKLWKWSMSQDDCRDSIDSVFEEEMSALIEAEIER